MKKYGAEFFGTFWLVLGGCFVRPQFQAKGELRHFHGLRVNVHAVDVGQQDFLSEARR